MRIARRDPPHRRITIQRKCALGVQRDSYDPRTASWTLLTAGSALYERLFTMQAFARSIGSVYAMLTPRDVMFL